MPRQQRVNLDEVIRCDVLAAIGEELEIVSVLPETLAQHLLGFWFFLKQTFVNDVANVGGRQMDAELWLEATLELAEHVGVVGLFEFLLAGHEEPRFAFESLSEFGDEGLQLEHPLLILVDVL